MPTYLTPGVYFETADISRRGITAIRTDIAAFVGIAERGPLHAPTRVKSWAQFQSLFGDFIPGGYLAYSVKAFFENGGQTCYVVRVAAAEARAAEAVLLDERGQPTLRVRASSPGRWGNELSVWVGRSSLAATRTLGTPTPQPPDRQSSLVESVAGFAVGSLVKVFQDYLLAPEYRIVKAVDPQRKRLTWDTPLLPAFDLQRPISLETVEFSLSVYRRGRLQQVFSSLSLFAGRPEDAAPNRRDIGRHARYVGEVVGTDPASLVEIESLKSVSPWPQRLPALLQTAIALEGGRDGIATLQPADFVGQAGAGARQGLRTLETVDEVAIVAIPDILMQPQPPIDYRPLPVEEPNPCLPHDPPPAAPPVLDPTLEQPPTFDLEAVYSVHQALIEHCEQQRDRIALLDPPIFPGPVDLVDFNEIQGWRQRFDSTYAALYFPWVLVYDPIRLGNQVVRPIPPSGHVAGIFARTDLDVGVHKAPANVALNWAQDVTIDVSDAMQGALNPIGVNCIRTFPGRGLRVYGARTVSSDPDWRYVSVRRLLMMIEEAIEESIPWAVFEPNDIYLRQSLTMAIANFLAVLWERGALAGAVASDAFRVKCDDENNPPFQIDMGQLVAEVRVAPVKPAEFIVLRIGRTGEQLEITEMKGS
jgi:phage tail sheath protein FI